MTEATTLLQALAGGASRPSMKCKVGRILDQVDTETSDALTRALAGSDDWPTTRIAQLITQHVEPIGRSTVADHRDKMCGCYR